VTGPRRQRRPSWSTLWLIAVALITAAFIVVNRDEWPAIVAAARSASPSALVTAALFQLLWLVFFGTAFWASFNAVGVHFPWRRTLVTAWACNFVNMVVKTGGMGGMALFLRAANRYNHPMSRVALGYVLAIALGNSEFVLLLGLVLSLLWLGGDIDPFQLTAAGATFVLIGVALVSFVLLMQSPPRVEAVWRRIVGPVNRLAARLLRRGPLLDPEAGARAAVEAQQVMALVRERPARLLPALLADQLKEVSAILVLFAVLRAFDPDAPITLAINAYALTILFSYVSIVPGGVGVVEISLTALMISQGVPPGPAALTTVVYRLFEYWSPFLTGAVAARFSGVDGGSVDPNDGRA
jgi:putative heme transporter